MAIQIRMVDKATVDELMNQEGDTVPLYVMCALTFEPPRPMPPKEIARRAALDEDEEESLIPYGMQKEWTYEFVMLLNVKEPVYFKEFDGSVVYVLPSDTDLIEYEMLSAIHPIHNAWAYRIQPRFWNPYDTDGDSPMDEAKFFFKPSAEGADLGN